VILHGFAEVSKNLVRYKSQNNFVEPYNQNNYVERSSMIQENNVANKF